MSAYPIIMPDLTSRRHKYHFVTALNLLFKLGVSLDRVELLADGEYQNYRGEIVSQEPTKGTPIDRNDTIKLRVGFRSAVDFMPYQLFYGLSGITDRTDSWDEQARRLMAPFDAEAVRYRALATNETLKAQAGLVDLEHLKRFLKLFHFDLIQDKPDVEEALFWTAAMPLFNHWSGNAKLVCSVLEFLFGWKFRIVENIKSRHYIPPNLQTKLGTKESRLGVETVLGGGFTDYDSAYELQVRDVKPEQVSDLLPGRPLRKKLDKVLRLCMPNDLDVKLRITVKKGDLRLGKTGLKQHLGYSTYV
ncbi:MAG TPA: type VI secretion system baseplate subunit TssG [candidate division Zixibacteria bacterium]|nr:type VI secretion system baseplate subunit TssG [candidate division Zixibacteria bacterium]